MASNSCAPNALLSSYIHDALAMLESEDILDYFQDKGSLDRSLRKKLRSSLLSINLVMDDAENKHLSNKHKDVSRWLREVRDAVHDVDDILDEIQTGASQSKSKFLSMAEFQTTTSSSSDEEVQSRLKEVLDNLESLASEKDDLGLEKIKSSGAIIVSQSLEATSLVNKMEIICGRDDDKTKIIDLLNDDNSGNNLTVISIVGMGGMGKTTLARLVFNDKKMAENEVFQFKAWVCVSQDFDVTKVTRKILEEFDDKSTTSGEYGLNKLHNKLKEKLAGKKYLLVLDNVWEENEGSWKALLVPLLYGARGSKILVTTRSEKVASIRQCPKKVYKLKQLSEEQSWSLFAKHALCPANSTSEFEEIGKKIIKKCDGLPLALIAIGSLLYNKSSYDEWNTILTSHMWDRNIRNTDHDIISALILNYQSLPSSLKRCFAYCSLIPKGHEFDKDWLIELWMAENFLQVHQLNKGMKEWGDQFFDDLLSRSFFEQSTRDMELFVMHDLVNDLSTYVSKKFCLRLEDKEKAKNIPNVARHISNLKDSMQFEATCKTNKLCTFLSSSYHHSNKVDDLLCKCKCLCALSLSSCYGNLPYSIGNLKHLRYLNLSDWSGLEKLPDSICLLYNLQTLKLTGCYDLEELPSNMHRLVNLRHLDFEETKVRKMPDGMRNLKKLEVLSSFYVGECDEVNINQLGELLRLAGKLRIKELQNVTNPQNATDANLRNKIHLEELWLRWDNINEEVKRDGNEIEEDACESEEDVCETEYETEEGVLEKLQSPRDGYEIEEDVCENEEDGYETEYETKEHVPEKLQSPRDGYEIEEDVLEKLQPPANLKKLCIEGYDGTKFPFWLGDLSINNVVSLELKECKYCVSLPPLGMLPSLKELTITKLAAIKRIGAEFYGNNPSSSSSTAPFRSLQILTFWKMEAWEKWDSENESSSSFSSSSAFPCLKKLVLFDCPRLKSKLPQHLPSLLDLTISWCPQVVGAYKKELFPGSSYTSLQTLEIWSSEIQILQQGHPFFNSLQCLELHHCIHTDEAFPLYLFPKLHQLQLWESRKLERLDVGSDGTGIGGVTSHHHHHLTKLLIWDCPEFVSIPQTLFFPSLTQLEIGYCPKLASIPPPLTLFPSLTVLKLQHCPEVEWPEPEEEEEGARGGFPSTLEKLKIKNCPNLLASHNKWDLRTLTSLTHLSIKDEDGYYVDCEGWLSLPLNLERLNGKDVGTSI